MIEISVSKTYGDRKVLDIQKLILQPATVYAVIGSNGSGKSTLIQAIAGVIKTDGAVNLGGIVKENIGYMPQKSYAFDMSVLSNMMLPHMMKHRAYYRKKALDLLQKLDMSHLRKKNAARLSGGETQRLALARLLMRDYDVLLLDEPTASMDINSTALTEEVLRKYCERVRPVVVMATHSMQQARRLADYVIFLDNGKAEEIAPPEKLFACPSSDKTRDFLNFNFLGEQF